MTALQFRLNSPRPSLQVLDCRDRLITEIRFGGPEAETGYWPVVPVPSRVAATVIAVEDHRFYRHPGVDPLAVFRAIVQNLGSRRRVSGASTIAMQVARLQRPAERTYWNKFHEALDAVIMTVVYGRQRVLDQYLRLAPYGNGIRGIGYAARVYFDKPVDDLSWAEIAFLSAIPQQPGRMNPRTPGGRVRIVKRARRILERVRETGLLTDDEFHRATRQVAELTLAPRSGRPLEAIHLALYFEHLLQDYDAGDTPARCRIATAIDLDLQAAIAEHARMWVDAWAVSGAQNAAVIVVDARTRSVVASVGSTGYFNAARDGAIDYTRVKRSPGSTLKPFIYALAVEAGYLTAESRLVDGRILSGGFKNYDRAWLGDISMAQALASSRNVPAVHVLRRTGIHRMYGCFADLELHDYETSSDRYGLGMAIGGLPVTPADLARAYTVFIDAGRLHQLNYYTRQDPGPARRIFSPETTAVINRVLSDPMARLPSFSRMGPLEYDYPVAVKTGTSEGCRDAWTVAWSPEYLVVTWLGRPDGAPMRQVSGYRAAAELTHVIMDQLHAGETIASGTRFPVMEPVDEGSTPFFAGGVRIVSPENHCTYFFDPETPRDRSTLILAADTDPGTGRITWEIDGVAYHTGSADSTVTWPMSPGRHTIRALAENGWNDSVQIIVQ